MTELEVGAPAPDFEMADHEGRTWRLSDLRGRKVILYFYPADDTPGCTAEACGFRDSLGELSEAGYQVLGVSPQDAGSHRAFAAKYDLNFPLLVDEGGEVAKRYGVWRVRDGDRPFEGNLRSTFVIDEQGRLSSVEYGVDWRDHVDRLKHTLGV